MVVKGDEKSLDQIEKQVSKLEDVLYITDLTAVDSVCRELMLIKILSGDSVQRNEIIQIANIFRASIIDVSKQSITLAVIGDETKTEAIQNLLQEFGILELVRTGMVALERGQYTIDEQTKEKGEFDYGKNILREFSETIM